DFPEPVGEAELAAIEQKMHALLSRWKEFSHREVSPKEARAQFARNAYKLELIDELDQQKEAITLYTSGAFTDLCRGGHVEKPSEELQHFKLLSVAGAYWRGSEKNSMLTRIYGTAFSSKKELDEYLQMKEEAKKRDHKVLGPQLDLFTFSELVGSGLPLWTPKGMVIRSELDNFVWQLRQEKGYQRVEIPHITKKDLYETSGHWDKFKDELFRIVTREGHEFAMKPMNCPHHTQIFARKPHSYREMPQRYANTTMVYRDEQSGELAGLSRVRSITQDDAHVFCRPSQIKEEMFKIWDIIDTFYSAVGFDLDLRISLSDPAEPKKYLGKRDDWLVAEATLREMADERGVEAQEVEGEAAFYGPKLDFMARDALGREWQVATIQLDMNMPERFDLYCINESGEKERVVMIHAAIMGAIERYLSILIEHYAGAFPVWLSPVQVKILPISDKFLEYAHSVEKTLQEQGVRVELDERSERLSAKIRDAQLEKTPYMLVVGEKEQADNSVAVRTREGGAQEVLALDSFVEQVVREISERA
ncbi:threonine--tRNA ligase, partial [Candidatus Woesebacteria bacterium]|nr:threonine--tRNA ligase [Candidatus Woesebacteria bacterium]